MTQDAGMRYTLSRTGEDLGINLAATNFGIILSVGRQRYGLTHCRMGSWEFVSVMQGGSYPSHHLSPSLPPMARQNGCASSPTSAEVLWVHGAFTAPLSIPSLLACGRHLGHALVSYLTFSRAGPDRPPRTASSPHDIISCVG
jgi:hypothetical protein